MSVKGAAHTVSAAFWVSLTIIVFLGLGYWLLRNVANLGKRANLPIVPQAAAGLANFATPQG